MRFLINWGVTRTFRRKRGWGSEEIEVEPIDMTGRRDLLPTIVLEGVEVEGGNETERLPVSDVM